MRAMKRLLLVTLLPALISACGSVEIQPGETEAFADMGYTYYRWHSVPVQDPDNGHVPGRAIDPTVRQAVDEALKFLISGGVVGRDPERPARERHLPWDSQGSAAAETVEDHEDRLI